MSARLILITGCSCGGKSTLLDALRLRGFMTVPEPGRRIVAEALAGDGKALPWVDLEAFALPALAVARSDLEEASRHDGPVFFDRGLIDAAVAREHAGGPSVKETLGKTRPYDCQVFVLGPWRALFAQDAERRHDFDMAVQEYHRIIHTLDDWGCQTSGVLQASVEKRAEIVLQNCGLR